MKKICLLIFIFSFCVLKSGAQMVKLDSTFNSTGIATFGTTSTHKDYCTSSILQPDGKILMCGWTIVSDTDADILIVRVLEDGKIDSTFGNGGKVQADYNGNREKAFAIALQEDGRIVIAGEEYIYPYRYLDFALLRLLPNGTPDSTFGNAGWVITDLGTENEFIAALAIQGDGKIIAAGRIEETTPNAWGNANFAMVRYFQDGTLDTQFGDAGLVQTTFFNSPFTYDEAHSIAVLPSGKMLLGGFANHGIFALSMYSPNGSLDSTFGENGLVTTNLGTNLAGEIIKIRLLQDGRFHVCGPMTNQINPGSGLMGLARYLQNGDLDHEFGYNGITYISIGQQSSVHDFVMLPDGRILICGTSNIVWDTQYDWLLARLKEDGKLDTTFGTNGYFTMPMGGQGAVNLWIQADSSILVTGGYNIPFDDDYDFAAARFLFDKTSSIADLPSKSNIYITPNPSHGTFWINLDSANSSDLHIVINDLFGRSVFSSMMNTNNAGHLELSLPNLQVGCYLIQVADKNSQWVRKLLIQK